MSESSAPVGDTLEQLIGQFLKTIPETWTEYDTVALSEMQERALYMLTAAGMIERRLTFRLLASGHPLAVEATITCTGEGGLIQAVEYLLADMWSDWREAFEKRNAGDLKDAPMFHCQRIDKEQWRLTADGVQARRDLGAGQSSMVFDFVLKRGFFNGQPRLLPNGRISQRLPVGGKGNLERIHRVRPDASPAGVNITNWPEGAQAFGAAFAELFKVRETQAAAASAAGAAKPKRSTERGEGREKLIAELTRHHKYAEGGCLNSEPIGNNELARAADVSPSTASKFFRAEFRGHVKYRALCRDAGKLAAALKLLNGEFSPHDLYGRRPPDEAERAED
jgi:hypothetical protein